MKRVFILALILGIVLFPKTTAEQEKEFCKEFARHYFVYSRLLSTPTFLTDPELFDIAHGIVDGLDSSGILVYFSSFEQAVEFFVILYLVESGLNPKAVSFKSKHIRGLGQVDLRYWTSPWAWKVLGYQVKSTEYDNSLYIQGRLPVHIFKYYLDQNNGNFTEAIRKYSGGVKNNNYLCPLLFALK